MNILAIQSHVAYGHVGLGAGLLPLWRLGHEVWPVATVAYSNHPAYGSFEGRVAEDTELAALITGVAARGALAACDAVLSGYLGSGGQGAVVLDAVAHVRSSSVSALYCCDPVMAHEGQGFFVAREIAEFMRAEAVPAADIVTPNQVELEYLSGRRIEGLEDALAACQAVRAAGPGLVVVTSLEPGSTASSTAPATSSPRCFSATTWCTTRSRMRCRARSRAPTACSLRTSQAVAGSSPSSMPRRRSLRQPGATRPERVG